MTNKEIASKFNLLGKLMELYGENPFKIRSYSNAYLTIRKLDVQLVDLSNQEISEINGVGKAIAKKISQLKETGTFPALERYLEKTPDGIQEMLQIKGLGAKKVKQLWNDLDINSPGELLYACHENRLVELKGFGAKTQANIQEAIGYYLDSKGSYLYAHIESEAHELLKQARSSYDQFNWRYIGDFSRKMPVVELIELATDAPTGIDLKKIPDLSMEGATYVYNQLKLRIHHLPAESFYKACILKSAGSEFLDALPELAHGQSEEEVFEKSKLPFIPKEYRESAAVLKMNAAAFENLITEDDIEGVVHNHSTYSDGIHTLEQMAEASRDKGYSYLVITDHSKSAFYANGLQVDRLMNQLDEIAMLNERYDDFVIFSGIESDVLNNGDLDYEKEILDQLDVVIASVHSNLRMDEKKATDRIIKAVEHPNTHILGHPTGRLLLSRKAYPLDHKKVIDACAANHVAIEINANPYRLDIDWTWIPYCMEKGVMISINPDAHAIAGIGDIKYGVIAGRKGGLTKQMTLNSKSIVDFEDWLRAKT